MCTNIRESKKKSFIGYKVVIMKKGRYYSPAMGIEYKKGLVKIPKRQKILNEHYRRDILKGCFVEGMVGRTAVFRYKRDARKVMCEMRGSELEKNASTRLIKMKIKGEMCLGEYGCYPVVLGKSIVFMRKL